jgi:predicted RNA-binding protein YlxR (DUF448 family)
MGGNIKRVSSSSSVCGPSEPIRTSIATGKKYPQSQLLRVVVCPDDPAIILPDPQRRLPGRGAWIEPNISSLELAVQRRAFVRALRRVSTPVDTGQVRKYLEELSFKEES